MVVQKMVIKINKKLGDTAIQFEIEKQKDKEALFLAGSLVSMPTRCGICGNLDVVLTGNKAKEFTFVKVICNNCKARSQMGEYKDGSGFYWKDWEKYVPQEGPGRDGDIPVIEEDDEKLTPENF